MSFPRFLVLIALVIVSGGLTVLAIVATPLAMPAIAAAVLAAALGLRVMGRKR